MTPRWFLGAPLRLPGPLDVPAERWARLAPRVRMIVAALVVATLFGVTEYRVRAGEARWGGPPVTVLVAAEDLPAGAPAEGLRAVRLPPAAVPPGAVTRPPAGDAVLSVALPGGSVLTSAHLDPRGPAAALGPDLRAVPIPMDDSWGVPAGAWVDVWVLGTGEAAAALVARSRPVLAVTAGTAVIGLHVDEVGPTSEGLALGRVLLAQAPPAGAGEATR